MPTIQEMREAKRRLEDEIETFIAERYASFAKETGVAPKSIDVCIVNVGHLGDPAPSYALSHVTVTAAIEL
jgi:hypothetical protein